MTKRKTFFAGLYVAIVYIIVILYMTSCTRPERHRTPTKQATEVINHSDKDIIMETLHNGSIHRGIYKVTIDSSVYIVVSKVDAVAITKHN